MAGWRLTAMGAECVFVFFAPARLRVVVWASCKALWDCGAPAALCRYTRLCFHAHTHQNGPVRLLSPGTSTVQGD